MYNIKNIFIFLFFFIFSVQLNAQTAEDYFKEGEARSRQQKYTEAIIEYSNAIKKDPKFWNAYLKRAFCYGLTEQYDKAVEDYTIAIAAEPEKIFSYQNYQLKNV